MIEENWYNLSVEETIEKLHSGRDGLSTEEAKRRLSNYGFNELKKKKRVPNLIIFIRQFMNLMVIILIIAVVISAFLGEMLDASVILIIVVLNAVFGFIQERKAEKSLEALKALAAPRAKVRRAGKEEEIWARELVPGDIVSLKIGDKVPADCRLIETINLRANEASLTGESVPISKSVEKIDEEDLSIGERRNMIFSGCTIEYGRGKGIIVRTGMKTELGKIAGMVQEKPPPTPLQIRLTRLGKQIGVGILGVCIIIFLFGLSRGGDILEMFITSVSLAVAAIPEGLPAVVTVGLALGLQRMVKKNAIIRRLPAVETLGSASVICSDKTGTLTKGEMNVQVIYSNDSMVKVTGEGFEPHGKFLRNGEVIDPLAESSLDYLLKGCVLCNDARLEKKEGRWKVVGDTTEGALLVVARKAGLIHKKISKELPRIEEIPFESKRKRMTTIHQINNKKIAFIKGAPEVILQLCNKTHSDEIINLSPSQRKKILDINQEMADDALRVLGLAFKEIKDKSLREEIEKDLVFLGLVGMIDSPREDATRAMQECKNAGIRVVMITGDHKLTAKAIAKKMNLLTDDYKVLSGKEVDKLSDEELSNMVEDIAVYARVSPEHKMRIIDGWKSRGHAVAMTGDGVNDAPALKKADIGIAMGITGTDVSKEAADMVLTDDNFASIVDAVKEGRGVYNNIRKFVSFLLSCNTGEVLTMFIATLIFAEAIPFLVPLQILWMNLVTDGLPALALSVDPSNLDIMKKKPRKANEGIISKHMLYTIFVVGIITCIGTLGIFALEYNGSNVEKARTIAFTTIVMFQLFFVFSVRSPTHPLHEIGFFTNKKLIIAVISSILLQITAVYVPVFNGIFGTVPLELFDWLKIIAISSTAFIAVEVWKIIKMRMKNREIRHRN